MKRLLLILMTIFIFSCSKESNEDNLPEVIIPKNSLILKVDGETRNENIVKISAVFCCNQKITINIDSKKNGITSQLLKIILLKNGELVCANFNDKNSDPTYDYQTPDFIPSSTFIIEDFEFVENKKLTFKFSGNLFKKVYNYNHISQQININGIITINEFEKCICNSFNNSLQLNDNIKFYDFSMITQYNNSNQNISYVSNSLNGYNFQIINLSNSLINMPLGTYIFDNISTSQKIIFQKYIGPTIHYYSNIYVPNYWKLFETQGNFTIIEKTQINGYNVARVKLNFTANYNGVNEFNFSDAELLISY